MGTFTSSEWIALVSSIGLLVTAIGAAVAVIITAVKGVNNQVKGLAAHAEGVDAQLGEIHTLTNSSFSKLLDTLADSNARAEKLEGLVAKLITNGEAADKKEALKATRGAKEQP